MAGPAVTLRFLPARQDIETLEVIKTRAHPQRRPSEEIAANAVLAVDRRGDVSAAAAASSSPRLRVRGAEERFLT